MSGRAEPKTTEPHNPDNLYPEMVSAYLAYRHNEAGANNPMVLHPFKKAL